MQAFLQRAWYYGDKRWWLLLPLLWPLSLVVAGLARLRRWRLQAAHDKGAINRGTAHAAPVVVVGNISLGGTGKTPLIIALTEALQAAGWRVGIISRGYGGNAQQFPLQVTRETPTDVCGDEPKLLAQRTQVPLVVDPDRLRAKNYLLAQYDCNLVLSDDGLQHYRLARDVEIIVVDGARGLGNGLRFPAGPLREPASRLAEADFCVINSAGPLHPSLTTGAAHAPCARAATMTLAPVALVNLASGEVRREFSRLQAGQWQAVCGIGNPARFFFTLDQLQCRNTPHSFPDHHAFAPSDFAAWGDAPVVMTEKDAVKCRAFAKPHWWYVQVAPQLSPGFTEQLLAQLNTLAANA